MQIETKHWFVGILAGGWIAATILGLLHSNKILNENINPILHSIRDWIIYSVIILPIACALVKALSKK